LSLSFWFVITSFNFAQVRAQMFLPNCLIVF
jgi:hypothetical protein